MEISCICVFSLNCWSQVKNPNRLFNCVNSTENLHILGEKAAKDKIVNKKSFKGETFPFKRKFTLCDKLRRKYYHSKNLKLCSVTFSLNWEKKTNRILLSQIKNRFKSFYFTLITETLSMANLCFFVNYIYNLYTPLKRRNDHNKLYNFLTHHLPMFV